MSIVVCLLSIILPMAVAQSGRPTPTAPTPKPPTGKPSAPPVQETRPRRASNEDPEQEAIKLSADLVTAITAVTDAAGNQVNNLTKDDFVIYEDNQAQEISNCYKEGQLPLRLVFLFDTSTSIRSRFDFEQRAAAQFFRQVLRAGDTAAVISVSSDPILEIPFTSDVNRLVNTLASLRPAGATALYNALSQAAKLLRKENGRHVMVVLSDGTDTASGITLAQALKEAQLSDTIIYAVHSTGIAPSVNVQDLGGEFVMKAMSEDTGGKAFFPPIFEDAKKEGRDLDEIYKRIAAEVRAQYVLTYYSKNDSRTKTYRTLRVEAKRPGLQVRARKGYYISKD
ncbi:MAG: VWA domain-containing protein [Acidobacteria bacterium]|nr:VWA domain-containing protein [Acidobacteriota bacterium]